MRKFLLSTGSAAAVLLGLVYFFPAHSQLVGPVYPFGQVTPGHCMQWYAYGYAEDSGAACGGSITLQTNGTNNLSQTTLNLVNSNSLIFTNTSGGDVTAAETQPYRTVTGTTDTISCTTDANGAILYNSASAVAVTVPQATGSCAAGFSFTVENAGAGTVTLTPTTSTINGATTLALTENQGASIVSDGTNYQVFACTACVGGSANAVVTNPSATQTITAQSATVTPLIVQGAASQSADIFDVEGNGGGKDFYVTSSNAWGDSSAVNIEAGYAINLYPGSGAAYYVSTNAGYLATGSGTNKGGGFGVAFIPNASTTGTTVDTLTKLSGGSAVIASISDTSGIIGITESAAGTTGNANLIISGGVYCVFDGATTAGDYVQISATTAGDCHDATATRPTSGEIIGRVLSTNAAAGTYKILEELENE